MSRPRQPADEAAPLLAAVLLFYLGCLLMFRRLSALLGPARGPAPDEEEADVRKMRTGQIILDNKELIREVFSIESTRVGGGDEGQRVSCKINEIVEARYEKERRRSQRPAADAESVKSDSVPPEEEQDEVKRLRDEVEGSQSNGGAVKKTEPKSSPARINHGKKRLAPKPPAAEPIKTNNHNEQALHKPPEPLPKLEVATEVETQKSHAAEKTSVEISNAKVKGASESISIGESEKVEAVAVAPQKGAAEAVRSEPAGEDQTEKLLKISSEIKLAIAEFKGKAEGASHKESAEASRGQGCCPPDKQPQVGEEATDKPVLQVESAETKEEKTEEAEAAQQVDNKDVASSCVATIEPDKVAKKEPSRCEVIAEQKKEVNDAATENKSCPRDIIIVAAVANSPSEAAAGEIKPAPSIEEEKEQRVPETPQTTSADANVPIEKVPIAAENASVPENEAHHAELNTVIEKAEVPGDVENSVPVPELEKDKVVKVEEILISPIDHKTSEILEVPSSVEKTILAPDCELGEQGTLKLETQNLPTLHIALVPEIVISKVDKTNLLSEKVEVPSLENAVPAPELEKESKPVQENQIEISSEKLAPSLEAPSTEVTSAETSNYIENVPNHVEKTAIVLESNNQTAQATSNLEEIIPIPVLEFKCETVNEIAIVLEEKSDFVPIEQPIGVPTQKLESLPEEHKLAEEKPAAIEAAQVPQQVQSETTEVTLADASDINNANAVQPAPTEEVKAEPSCAPPAIKLEEKAAEEEENTISLSAESKSGAVSDRVEPPRAEEESREEVKQLGEAESGQPEETKTGEPKIPNEKGQNLANIPKTEDEAVDEDHLMKKIESFLVTESKDDEDGEIMMSEPAVKLESRNRDNCTRVKRVSSFKKPGGEKTAKASGEKDRVDGGEGERNGEACGIQSGGKVNNADKKIKADDATKLAAGKQPTQAAPKIGFGVLRPRPKSGGPFTPDPQPRPKSDELSEVFNKIVLRKAEENKRRSSVGTVKSRPEAKAGRRGSIKTKETNGTKEKSPKSRETSPLKNGAEEVKLKKNTPPQLQGDVAKVDAAVADAVKPDLCAAKKETTGPSSEPQKTNSGLINTKPVGETKRDDAASEARKDAASGDKVSAKVNENNARPVRRSSSKSPAKTITSKVKEEAKTTIETKEVVLSEKVGDATESTVRGQLVLGQKLDKEEQSAVPPRPESIVDRVSKRLEQIRAAKEQTPETVFFRSGVLGQLEAQRDEKLQDHVTRLQARCKGYLARRRFEKRKVQEVAVRCVQRNVRRFLKVRDWPWWRLLVRVAPLLNVHRAEEELRKQTEELEGMRVRLDKSEAEKLRLKQHNERLEARMNELTVALAEEQSAAHLAAERLEAESAERSRLQHELQNAQEKQSSLREASQRLEMEILMCRASDDASHTSGEDEDGGYEHLKQRLDRAVKEAAALRRQLQQQQEAHEDQLMALRKASEKRVADALEEVEEQRQVVAQMKRKAQRVTGEHNDTRLMLEEQSARNTILEKRQKKFDSEMHQLQEAVRQEKSSKEKALRERDLMAAEKTSAEQNLAACRLELEMRDEKVAALGRELEELAFGGAAEEEVAALRKSKHALERRVKEQEEELDELAGQVGLLEAAKVRLEMSLEQQRKEAKREASQRDDEMEEIRGNAQKKVRALESQLEAEHEERTRLLREKHDLDRRLAEAAEVARGRAPEDEQMIQRLRRELRHAKALLRDAHGLLERQRDETGGRGQLRALRHQLEDAEAARAVAMKARQTAESEARELQAALEEEKRGRALAEDKAAAAVRSKTEVVGQLEENEEELAEVLKKYRASVAQISIEQAATTELAATAAALEAERNSLREQVAEMSARLEAAEGETTIGLTARRLETKIRELESRLELEATTRARAETQCGRFREQAEKVAVEAEAARARETAANDAARRAARQLREAREREASVAAKEAEAIRKRKELEMRVETCEAEAATARADLRLALQRIEDLQAAMAGDSEDLGSESSGSIESLLDSVGGSQEFLDFACRSPEGQSDPGDGVGHLTDSKDESHA
ncbi:axoneme-associated protein mst101(2) isoform X2 [Neocloeon triangulifer]|uniref:axoneme-associated protein mst101(2) isoform X2 n=1 Tax=Neocloeon triangulifer TaxID=2078957 RepID=UPI00286FAE26|nr:axoneme-associated protein mst101(2) isoform X2 [Neocloeon triangulifer]